MHAEFYNQLPKTSVQDRIRQARSFPPDDLEAQTNYNSSVKCHEFLESPHQCLNYEQEQMKANTISNLENTMQQLYFVMHTVTLNPGQYESLAPQLISVIKDHFMSTSELNEIIGSIVQQSIGEDNFRYSGARLCKTLKLKSVECGEILCAQCAREAELAAIAWESAERGKLEESRKKCHGLILFVAELIVQMDNALPALGEILIQLMFVVLKNPAPNSVKYICQALKLAGSALERDKRGSRIPMENMMRTLTDLVTKGAVDLHIGRMVNNVCELRNSNWGQCSVPAHSSVSHHGSNALSAKTEASSNNATLYGPDGIELSFEEREFLQGAAVQGTDSLEDDVEEEGTPFIDDEDEELMIASAYEEFLALMPNKTDKKKHNT
ncbi:polyadenylate-binding protein-interacting protein 1-like isoform X2 [Prorops nasuta]